MADAARSITSLVFCLVEQAPTSLLIRANLIAENGIVYIWWKVTCTSHVIQGEKRQRLMMCLPFKRYFLVVVEQPAISKT